MDSRRAAKLRRLTLSMNRIPVAQVFNLLYRRVALGKAVDNSGASDADSGLKIRDTAEYNSAPHANAGSWSQCVRESERRLSLNRGSQKPARFWTAPVLWRFGSTVSPGGEGRHRLGGCASGGKAAEDCRSPKRCRAGVRRAGVHGPNARSKDHRSFPQMTLGLAQHTKLVVF